MRRAARSKIPAVILAAVTWLSLIALVLLVDPNVLQPFYLAPFWLLVSLALTWTIWLITGSARKGVLYALAITIYLGLRHLRIGHPLNGFLLLAIAITLDWYLSLR